MPVNSIYKIKKIQVIAITVIIVMITGDFFYYNGLYKKQINYIENLLDRQVQIVGLSVDNTDDGFISGLHQITLSEDITQFFSNQEQQIRTVDKMKLFFSKYENLITGIKLYDNNKNEFTLKKDETGNNWLEQIFVLHVQGEIIPREVLIKEDRNYEYFLPVENKDVLSEILLSQLIIKSTSVKFSQRSI